MSPLCAAPQAGNIKARCERLGIVSVTGGKPCRCRRLSPCMRMSRFEIVILKCPVFWVRALLAGLAFYSASIVQSQRAPCFLLSRDLLGQETCTRLSAVLGPKGGCWNGERDPSAPDTAQTDGGLNCLLCQEQERYSRGGRASFLGS